MDHNSQLQPINQHYDNPVNELTLQDYLIILRIHLKKIIILTLIVLAYYTYNTYTIPPQFQATATVMVREKPGADMVVDFGENRNRNRMENEIQLIKSRALAKDVVKEFWNSNRRNNLHVFGTRKFYPRGQRPRRIAKELLTLGLYDPTADISSEYNEPYSDEIGDQFAEKTSKKRVSGEEVNGPRKATDCDRWIIETGVVDRQNEAALGRHVLLSVDTQTMKDAKIKRGETASQPIQERFTTRWDYSAAGFRQWAGLFQDR